MYLSMLIVLSALAEAGRHRKFVSPLSDLGRIFEFGMSRVPKTFEF